MDEWMKLDWDSPCLSREDMIFMFVGSVSTPWGWGGSLDGSYV